MYIVLLDIGFRGPVCYCVGVQGFRGKIKKSSKLALGLGLTLEDLLP